MASSVKMTHSTLDKDETATVMESSVSVWEKLGWKVVEEKKPTKAEIAASEKLAAEQAGQ